LPDVFVEGEIMRKAVLFDFDGVLTLEETGSESICNYVSKVAKVDKDLFKREYRKFNSELLIGKLKHEDVWRELCDRVGAQIDIQILHDSFIHTPINMKMLKLARNIKSKGYKLGLVTDNKTDRMKSIIKFYDLNTVFDGIVVSAEVGAGKDKDLIFWHIFEKLDVAPSECVFIDNKEENLIVPKSLGVSVIHFDFEKKDMDKLRDELFHLIGVEV